MTGSRVVAQEGRPPAARISVILCTYNRATHLRAALTSLLACDPPAEGSWELIVVDNNSTDETGAVVEEFRHAFPEVVRYLFCPQQGKSHALNAGIDVARGELLVFTDDDVTFSRRWLRAYARAMTTGAAGYAGPIVAMWDRPRPRWYSEDGPYRLMDVIVRYDLGSEARVIPTTRPPFGANMAFRREVFERHGTMRTDLGPVGRTLLRGEDTEFGRRVMAAGDRIEYVPGATVYHPVENCRLRRGYFLRFYFHYGRCQARLHRPPPRSIRYFGVPRYLFRTLAGRLIRWLTAFGSKRRFYYKLATFGAVGLIVEEHHIRRSEQ